MKSVEWLQDKGFRHVADWQSAESVVHKEPWLQRQPGLYAFVVNGEVRYIGKADRLHRRLRNYSRRSFVAEIGRGLRTVHKGIRAEVRNGPVSVYARHFDDGAAALSAAEAALIREAQPIWNVSLVSLPSD